MAMSMSMSVGWPVRVANRVSNVCTRDRLRWKDERRMNVRRTSRLTSTMKRKSQHRLATQRESDSQTRQVHRTLGYSLAISMKCDLCLNRLQ